ncbi:hypothetical protein POM88_010937 [Heracleum sosnowskyi]|uniref:F-box domain-containing protein n=1 Tax=Heracleum sosnowskyi TaxID=360622 RepID=A0AAD8IUM0_9APIA|nr:hypothetical protein POM88_010937 [Heracleum sosnowskyi]
MKRSRCDHYIPEEVMFKILSFTKVTSLLRFKSVCKPWRSNISKPKFIQAHHPNSLNFPSILIITSTTSDPQQQQQLSNNLGATLVYFDASRVSPPLPSIFGTMKFVSSCNGIVCVCDNAGANIYLFNPLTSMSKKVPPVVVVNRHVERLQEKAVKVDVVFGFDCVLNDFKVLRIQYRKHGGTQLVSVEVVEVYSSNADSWREIEVDVALPSFVLYPLCSVLISGPVLDGVLYLEGMNEIVTFDLRSEVFGLITFPGFMKTRISNVLDVEGSIGVVVESVGDGDVGKEVSMWTMEMVSDEVFWNKKFKFDACLEIDWVFLYLGAKQYVVRTREGEMLYDHGKKEIKSIGLPSRSFLTRVLKHAESFISIQGFEKVREN